MRAARAEAWSLALAALLAASCGTDVVRLQGHVNPPATKPECVVRPPTAGGVVCVYCGADYTVQRACLKCGTPTDSSMCATCVWSDGTDAADVCEQCSDASGKVISTVRCNELRPDLYAPGT